MTFGQQKNTDCDAATQHAWRGVRVYDAIGTQRHLTIRQMRLAVSHPLTVLGGILAVAVLVVLDVHGYSELMPPGGPVLLWTASVVTLVGLYLAIILPLAFLSKRIPWIAVYSPVVGVLAMSLNTVIMIYNASMLMGVAFDLDLVWSHLLMNIALGFIVESVFTTFALPLVYNEGKVGHPDVSPLPEVAPRTIVLGGQDIDPATVSRIAAQDHYLEVWMGGSPTLLRARLSDAISQLSDEDGVSPHRSHWVSRQMIKGAVGGSTAMVLHLTDGSEIPVARGRTAEVRKWLEG